MEMPLLNCEVRGVAAIQTFAHYLLNPCVVGEGFRTRSLMCRAVCRYALTEEGRPLAMPDEKLVSHFYDVREPETGTDPPAH